jgi:DNA-binding IclR family transcriptional regulator
MVSAVQKPQAAPAYPIASVDNALRLLMLFRDTPRVRLSEASEHLGVAHSTAHRLMAMLAYHGFVRQEPGSRAYLAGPALVEIGLAAVRAQGCAVKVEESEDGVASVAVAVRGPRPRQPGRLRRRAPAASISVSAPVSRMTAPEIETIAAELRERAAELASLI